MKNLFLSIVLLCSVASKSQIVKLIKTSDGQFGVGTAGGALDDLRGGAVGDSIWVFAGTDNASTFNEMYGSGDKGITWRQLSNAPWGGRNAMGVANGSDRIYMWGGQNIAGTKFDDSWYYMNGAWTQISSSMTNFGTLRQNFSYAYTQTHFITIGGFSKNDVLWSTDLQSWSVRATLPDSLKNTGATDASWDNTTNILYVAGGFNSNLGVYVGKLWQSLDSGLTWTSLITNSIFADEWPNIKFFNWGAFYVRGNNGTNQQGCYVWYRGTDISNISNWHRLIYEVPPRHASALFRSQDKTEGYLVMGNFWNESWWIKNIVQ